MNWIKEIFIEILLKEKDCQLLILLAPMEYDLEMIMLMKRSPSLNQKKIVKVFFQEELKLKYLFLQVIEKNISWSQRIY